MSSITSINSNDRDKCDLLLGRFLTAWCEVEEISFWFFSEMEELPAVTARKLFYADTDQMRKLHAAAEKNNLPRFKDEIQAAVATISALSERRNKIVHGTWIEFNGEPARMWQRLDIPQMTNLMYGKADAQRTRAKFIHTLSDIADLIEECATTYKHTMDLKNRMGGQRTLADLDRRRV